MAAQLGFTDPPVDGGEEGEEEGVSPPGLEECKEWLSACGCKFDAKDASYLDTVGSTPAQS